MTVGRFDRDTLPVTPWKNGGGTTREIASWPPGAGLDAFDWRVSIATIAASGPFSVFGGVDRTIMLLDGEGVRLHAADGSIAHRLDRPHQPFAFRGDVPIDCTVLGGASSDFNVMSRRAKGTADVRVLTLAQTLDAAPAGLLMALHGRWRVDDRSLAAGEGLWWADTPTAWALAPRDDAAELVAVRWTPRHRPNEHGTDVPQPAG
jgi:environmental stress-induced protein Ves